MARYLISFDDGAMTFPEEELPDVAAAAHAVAKEAQDSGVWVFGGGLHSYEEVSVVATEGTVTDAYEEQAYIGGFLVVDVPSREEALEWAAKIAVACRCAQEVPRVRARFDCLMRAGLPVCTNVQRARTGPSVPSMTGLSRSTMRLRRG